MIFEQIHGFIGTRAMPDVLSDDAGGTRNVVLPMGVCAECGLFDQSADVDRLLARSCVARDLFPG